ncbi:MAG: rRNA pseudouridine synthase [candidate division Zixibacteria bacterium]|nr:rRNA pseudouridine synthase [candidate division Zixibacteria bacterium]MDH3938006.1 rRNA pseudouridine synthase [candidate division Zixibacteria bacterium]MDH4032352.1 rRNA pseudouridine synthase [candidate division Zixibacteria bacterium]
MTENNPVRINKYLSICGVTSRRGAEKLIEQQRVTINDHTAKVGELIDSTKDKVLVDGTEVKPADTHVYVVLNKPSRVMTTLHDPFKRRTVRQLLKRLNARVYPIGRLDYDTEGVLLMTNDGELAYRLTHPKFQVPRLYEAKVKGKFMERDSARIAAGIKLEDGARGHARVRILRHDEKSSTIRLVLTEGRKREVKQLCKLVGHPVVTLTRLEFGGITCRGIESGHWRELTIAEVNNLKGLVGLGK